MPLQHRHIINDCLRLLLKPIARFCLRHSLKLQEVLEQMKLALLEAAEEEMKASGDKINISRLGVMTGVHRPDVVRLYRRKSPKDADSSNALIRIIGRWQSDAAFLTPAGKPKTLSFDGIQNEFVDLVGGVSTDLNPYAILFEMERVGIVSKSRAGLRLKSEVYNPRGDMRNGFVLLSGDAEDLICSVEENLLSEVTPNHHIKTQYDRIAAGSVEKIRQWLLKEGMLFHKKLRDYLSQHDLDLNPKLDSNSETTRVAVASFSRIGESSAGRLGRKSVKSLAEVTIKKEKKKRRAPEKRSE